MKKLVENISRRRFVKSIGFASGGLILACNSSVFSEEKEKPRGEFTSLNPNVFIQLDSDGVLTLIASRSEMGNGVRTSITSIIADEMEADWSRVVIKQGTGDAKYGDQNTDGSRSVRYLYKTMRQLGASTKALLIHAAAQQWKVPASECYAKHHFIHHNSGKKTSFGALVSIAKTLEVPKNAPLKATKDFNYIGKKLISVDAKDYVEGNAVFGLDFRLPNMKFAAMKRCPTTFGIVKTVDKSQAELIKGVESIIEIPRVISPFGTLGGVAVIASNTWAAFKGKEALDITWEMGDNANYNSNSFTKTLTENVHKQGKEAKVKGDIKNAFKNATQIIESTFQLPHLAHTPMEVPNATAWVQGDTCQVWAPVQAPQTARKEVSDFLKIPLENVTINVTFLGGGFGRKSKPDFIVEAVAISKKINAPVQVVWTREDDIQHSYYHTISAQYLKASIDSAGNVTGWQHRFALPSITSTFRPGVEYAAGWEISSASNVPFDIPNFSVEIGKAPAHVRIGWLRSVINIPHGFSINVFADELAIAAEKDPLQFRLNLIGNDRIENTKRKIKYDTARLKNVLKLAAKNAGWGLKLPEGHYQGLAVHYSFFSYTASVVEVSMTAGKVKVHNIYSVIDCGTVINKDTVKAQMEGAAIFGLSLAFYGKITTNNGAVEQSNFHDYRMIRMPQAPKIQVEIVDSSAPPTGVGEPGVPVIAPALINAIFQATGKRYHNLPLSDYNIV